jgi:hypothetical protein
MVRSLANLFGQVPGRWRSARTSLVIALLALLVAFHPDSPGRSSPIVASYPATDRQCLARNESFRLGNAARPLGWSTAIADFNVDGSPDIAVADRIARSVAGYSYRIELSISGAQTDTVTFESANEAIQLRVSDVDADNDLDLVASAVLSKAIVGVWLNDGHGRFTSSDVREMPAAIGAQQVLDSTGPCSVPASFASRRQNDAGAAVLLRGPPPTRRAWLLASAVGRDFFLSRLSVAGPRAPPSSAALLIS